ncbi:MAG: ZIP family metal transporter [Planctomycetota bacterium]
MFESAVILAVALAGGCLPLLVRWTDRLLHSALALSTGIFLGAVFLHLLPSLAGLESASHEGEPVKAAAEALHAHQHGDTTIWIFVLIGVVSVYLIESLVFRAPAHDDLQRHRSVGYAALVGLSVHALTAGIGFAAISKQSDLATPLFLSIVAHKGFEGFSLTSVFLLAEFKKRKIVLLTVLFSLVTPIGILLGLALTAHLGNFGISVATALAAGTFLYVCLCELLPEVFHHREDSLVKIGLMAAGVILILFSTGAGA